jgi:hypothetical protein
MSKNADNQKIGNWRIKKRFLLLPLKLKNNCRWLKFVKIKQILTTKTTTLYSLSGEPYMVTKLKWIDFEFVNE